MAEWSDEILKWLASLKLAPARELEIVEEVAQHLEDRYQELVAGGTTEGEARRVAFEELSDEDLLARGLRRVEQETTQEPIVAGGRRKNNCLSGIWQDIRYGLRMLRKNPGFTAVAVITLALAIGANTAIFTVVNTVLLHPLPYVDSGRIVDIFPRTCSGCGASDSVPMFTFWQQNNPGFEDLTAYVEGTLSMNLSGGDRPEIVQALKVSRNYFRLFGASPVLGRTFSAEEDRPGGPEVLVMSYGLWQRRFGANPSMLGKAITLGGAPYTVVGVLSPRFKPYPSTDVWIPLQADSNNTDQAAILMVSGRLPRGTTLAEAEALMAVIGKRYVETHHERLGNDDKLEVTPMQQKMTGDVRPALLILLGAVGLVLLIACANVANLQLARALGRHREVAIRAAVGAGRARMVQQLLTESALLALGGGALGLALGSWGVGALLALTPGGLPRIQEMAAAPALDPWVAGFSVLLSLITGVVFGLVPAFQLSRTDLVTSLKESSGPTGTGQSHNRTRSALVAAEVGIAVVLLCGAMLLIRTFVALHSVQLGFDPQNLLTMKVALAGPEYAEATSANRLARQIVEGLEHIPGIETATMASSLPAQPVVDMIFDIPGRRLLEGDKFTGDVLWCSVSQNYFETLRIPLRSGRLFREQEPARTVIINEAMARKFWPKLNPVGQSIVIGAGLGPMLDQGPTEIVGVVGDVHDRLDASPPPTMYQSWSQVPDAAVRLMSQLYPASIAVRTKAGVAPMSVSKAVEQALLAGETQLPTTKVQTMEQVMLDSTAEANLNLLLLGIFAAIALLLAALGIYGVMSHTVQQRTHEIGVRVALGAERSEVLKLVVGQGLKMAGIGLGIGVVGALMLTRFLSSLLYGVKPADPETFIAVSLILAAVALLASYIPARRAAQVDPMVALRYE